MLVSSRAVLSLTSPRASLTINGTQTPAWASTAESLAPRRFFWPVMDVARLVKRRHRHASANWKRASSASKYFRTLAILFWLLARCCAPVCNTSAAGRSKSFHRKRVWTQPSKSQKRVITGRSSDRKHLRSTSRATSATKDCLLPLAAGEPLERPTAPTQCSNTPGAPLTSEHRLSGITRFPYNSCSPAHCATTAGRGAERCTWSRASTCARRRAANSAAYSGMRYLKKRTHVATRGWLSAFRASSHMAVRTTKFAACVEHVNTKRR